MSSALFLAFSPFPLLFLAFCSQTFVSFGRQLPSLLLDEVPDGDHAEARLLGDELRGHLFLHDSMVNAVLLSLVQRTEKGRMKSHKG